MRGPHHFWMSSGKTPAVALESSSSPNGLINLVHYDDAARVAFSAFTTSTPPPHSQEKLVKGEIFLVSDGQALTRREICNAALLNKVYSAAPIPNFKGDTDLMDGRRYNVAKVRSRLQWTPKFTHFSSFMAADYVNEMKVPLLS